MNDKVGGSGVVIPFKEKSRPELPGQAVYFSYFLNTIVALWPPKPNELLMAALISF
jgi:hypothetical protein